MFKRDRSSGEPTLEEAWRELGRRHGLSVDVHGDDSIRAHGVVRNRGVTVSIHRDRALTEPLRGLATAVRRRRMRQQWRTELAVGCRNPQGLAGVIHTFVDVRDPRWDPRNFDPGHCRVVRTDPPELAERVLTPSIHARLAGMRGDHQLLVEPTQIRLSVTGLARDEGGWFVGSPIHNEFPGTVPPWPERALVGPAWWIDLLHEIADAVDA